MPEPEFFIKQGDTSSAITAQLKDDAGNPVNITGASVLFKMQPYTGTGSEISAAATITNAAEGRVSYTFTAPQTADAGWFAAEWQVTFAGGAIQTFPNDRETLVAIRPQVS